MENARSASTIGIIDSTIPVKCLHHEDGWVDYFEALLQSITERRRVE